MAVETLLASVTSIMGIAAVIACAGCDPGVTLPKDEASRGAMTREDPLRAQVALDVNAIIGGMMLAHGLRVASVQSEP
jgi:hypothetical protein